MELNKQFQSRLHYWRSQSWHIKMKEPVSESTPVFDGSILVEKSQKPENLRASLRVDSIIGWVDPSRKIQNSEILYASLRVDSSYGGVDPSRKYRMLFLFNAGEESTPDQEGSTSAFTKSTPTLLTYSNGQFFEHWQMQKGS